MRDSFFCTAEIEIGERRQTFAGAADVLRELFLANSAKSSGNPSVGSLEVSAVWHFG